MKTFKELEDLVIQWGEERNLYCPDNGATATSQRLKFFEEIGELASAFLKKDKLLIKDAIGDLQVVSINISRIENEDLSLFENNEILDNIRYYYKSTGYIFKELDAIEDLCKFCMDESNEAGFGRFALLEAVSTELGYDRLECLEHAYNEIKGRKGSMINRVFVKDA